MGKDDFEAGWVGAADRTAPSVFICFRKPTSGSPAKDLDRGASSLAPPIRGRKGGVGSVNNEYR